MKNFTMDLFGRFAAVFSLILVVYVCVIRNGPQCQTLRYFVLKLNFRGKINQCDKYLFFYCCYTRERTTLQPAVEILTKLQN